MNRNECAFIPAEMEKFRQVSPFLPPPNCRGFTLIELIVVIVILGILAATALPKFIDLSSDARAATMKSFEGAARSANAMLYAKAVLEGYARSAGPIAITTIDNTTNPEVRYGYASEAFVLYYLLGFPADIDLTQSTNTFHHRGAKDTSKCRMTYTPATATTMPEYVTDTSGC